MMLIKVGAANSIVREASSSESSRRADLSVERISRVISAPE
jgi:hypothetical protein